MAETATAEKEKVTQPIGIVKPKKFRIIIDEQDNSDNNGDVFVRDPSPDGKPYLIKRGEEVVVPVGVVNCLNEAVITLTSKDKDGNEVEKHIRRFAMRVIGEA